MLKRFYIGRPECPYMRRIVIPLPFGMSFRIHRFLRSDNDKALHDHPWWFVTFPLHTYDEYIEQDSGVCYCGMSVESHKGFEDHGVCPGPIDNPVRSGRTVKRFRFHFRPAEHRHAVYIIRPTTTFVLTGPKRREWGFWQFGVWTPWKSWFDKNGLPPCVDDEVGS